MTKAIFLYGQDDRPYASVTLQNGSIKLPVLPLIDSGADMTILPKDVGEALKLYPPTKKELKELEEMKKKGEGLKGLSGNPIDCVKRNIRIEIGDYNFSICVGWLFNKQCQILLGREEIFERFDILFKQNPDKKIIFQSDKKVLK